METAKAVPRNRYVAFFLIAVAGCAADLATKRWMFDWLGMPHTKPAVWLIDEVLGFETSLNEGALFGIGQGWTPVFAVLSVAAAIGVVYWLFVAGGAKDLLLTLALGCVMAGIFGNLYDRLGLHGLKWHVLMYQRPHEIGDPVYAVRDFIHFKIDAWNFDWPVFNLADSLLVCGAGLLLLQAFFGERPAAANRAANESGGH